MSASIATRLLCGIITRSPLNKIPSTSEISSCASKNTRTSGSSCARCSGHDVRTTWASFCSDWSRLVSSTSCVTGGGLSGGGGGGRSGERLNLGAVNSSVLPRMYRTPVDFLVLPTNMRFYLKQLCSLVYYTKH